MFQNLTVARRLALGFGITVALGVGITAFASLTLRALGHDIDQLAEDRMVKVRMLNEVKSNLQTIARRVRNIIIIDNDAVAYAAESKAVSELRAANSDLLAQLDKVIVLPEGRALLQIITDNRAAYNGTMDRAIAHALKNENQEASRILLNEVRPLQEKIFSATDESVAMQQRLATQLAESARKQAHSTIALMAALAAFMALVGLVVGWWMVRNLRAALGAEPAELNEAARRVADGDLSHPLQVPVGLQGSVLASMARMQTQLSRVVADVRSNAESVATASAQIAQGNGDLSQRTEEQASALQQTAATMEELNTTVRNNMDNAQQANQLAKNASEVASRGGSVVGEVVSTMQGISDSSRKIGDIIGVIDGIAFQTNILALNAAVEAARAGEQGRGFAVVAGEVRTLAQRSAEAAKEIKQLISRSVEQVEQGTALVDRAGQTMTEIVGSIQRVSDIVAEITSAGVEQGAGIAQVGQAVGQMDQATQQNAALVEQSAAAAESLKGQAQHLLQAVAVFRLSGLAPQPALASGPTPRSPATVSPTPPAPRPANVASPATRAAPREPASASADSDWSSF